MQSPLFGYTENQSADRFALQNQQMLRVNLDSAGNREVLARKGAMVAYQGVIEFDGEYMSRQQQRTRARTGEGLELMRCHGQGTVYLANLAQHIHILDVDREGITVDSAYVLALDANMTWEVIAVDAAQGIPGVGAYNLRISGPGQVALMTSGQPLAMSVTPDRYIYADADAVVAWSTDLRVSMQAQTSVSSVSARRGETGEGYELNFTGTGQVLVQPSELLPPQHMVGAGRAAAYGLGEQGIRGQNQDNRFG